MPRELMLCVAVLVATGCGERSESGGGIVPAAAFERPDKDEQIKKFEAVQKKANERAEAEAAKADAELAALTEAVTIVPEKQPKSIKVACAEVADALDSIVKRQFKDDPAGLTEWEGTRDTMLKEVRAECEDQKELDVAGCKAHAMRDADDRLVGDAFGLMARCQQKFGDEVAQKTTKP